MQAKIEIRSRDVKGVPNVPVKGKVQHLYIIHTDTFGRETVLRGGPESDNMVVGDLFVSQSEYTKSNIDWAENTPSQVIAVGTDAEMQAYVDKMWARGQEINNGRYDYKFPTPLCAASICHVQNSNTAVKEMVEAAGLELRLLVVNDKLAWVPGIDGTISQTTMDALIKGDTGTVGDYYVVQATSKEEVAAKYNVPAERIYETDTDPDLPGFLGRKPFIIMPAPKPSVMESQGEVLASGEVRMHTVSQGDTLSGIAREHGTTVENLLADERNQEFRTNPDFIRPGQTIHVYDQNKETYGPPMHHLSS